MKILSSCTFVLFMLSFSTATFAQNPLIGDNVVVSGDFAGDTLASVWNVEGGAGTVSVINGELAFTGLTETANIYDLQANQPFTAEQLAELEKGGNFELTFDARSSAEAHDIHVFLGEVGGGWDRYWAADGDGLITITNTTQTYKLTHNVTSTWESMRIGFEVASDTNDVFIDNVVLRRVEDNLLYDGQLVIGADSMSAAWNRVGDGGFATYSADNGEIKIDGLNGFSNIFDVQFIQELDSVQVDSIYTGPYEMFFDARTAAGTEKEIQVFFGNNGTGGDWTNWAPRVTVNDSMQTYALNITADGNWENMKIGFEVSSDDSPIWFDNVIVRRVRDIPPAAPVVNLSTSNGIVTLTVEPVADATTYEVYFADSAFTTSEGGSNVGTIVAEDGLTITHTTKAPHPTLVENFTAHYGVVAKKENGTASTMTASSIATDMSVQENYIVELGEDAVEAVAGALETGVVPEASALAGFFPDTYKPFEITIDNVQTEGTAGDSNEDISAKFWVGFENISGSDLFIIYAEIMDDVIVPAAAAADGGGGWNFDSWEGGFGSYAPESFITGSTHDAFESGDEPDYQLRAGFMVGTDPYIHGWDGDTGDFNQLIQNSATIGDSSQTGMYRLLTAISTLEFSGVNTGAKDFDYPTGEEVTTIPFQLAINDNDGTGRDAQFALSNKSTNQWWNTPSQWEVFALVGADAVFTVNDELEATTPMVYTLEQNYPNPFNPSTNIQFSLPATANVTLEVFNMLGQKVATLIDAQKMNAGSHTQKFDASSLASGMYVYRISTANFVQSRKMMLIK